MPSRKKEDYIIVFVTAPNLAQAQKIAKALLVNKEAACINLINNVKSFFSWKGKIEEAKEILLVIKSRKNLFKKIEATVRKHHSYSVPEIIALSITAGNKSYLNWMNRLVP